METQDQQSNHILKHASLLSGATDELRRAIEAIAVEVELERGETLFAQGDKGDALYLVDSGAIEISVVSPSGQKLWLNVMRPGDFFGEIALVDSKARTASAIALQPSKLGCVRRQVLFDAMRSQTELAFEFIQLLCDRLRWVSDLLEDRAFLPLPVRLARRLLLLADKMGDDRNAILVSQSDLADLVSATREGVAKVLATWRRRGWVDISRVTLRIVDRAALEGVASALEI